MRLNETSLHPASGVEPDSTFGWCTHGTDPTFDLRGAEAFAGRWVRLRLEIEYDGQLTSPCTLRIRRGSYLTPLRLFPDSGGRIRFIWRLPPDVTSMQIIPIGQPGRFAVRAFSFGALPAPLALALAAGGALTRGGQGNLARQARGVWRLLRIGGPGSVARRLMQMHNERAQTTFSEQRRLDDPEGSRNTRLQAPDRQQALEQDLADRLARSQRAVEHQPGYVPKAARGLEPDNLELRAIAFYLPQFHPIPENDRWWGTGFTEWTNVSKAQPQFVGHYQPHLPGELGFYDLRLPEVMHRQIELARHYGIAAFCFHYYWFGGRKLLERPLGQFLVDRSMNLQFCLCWANESWSRRWDGLGDEILIAQEHSPVDDMNFIEALLPVFADPRYLRVDDKPLLIVYHADSLPDAAATLRRWRDRAREAGLAGLHLVGARTFDNLVPAEQGFDAAVEFPPHQSGQSDITGAQWIVNPSYRGHVYDYQELASRLGKVRSDVPVRYKTVMPGWDNEARRPGEGRSFANGSAADYRKWLLDAAQITATRPPQQRLLFINAWNEWAEGAHLEPDRRWGYASLQATADALRSFYRDRALQARIDRHNAGFVKTRRGALVLHLYYEDLREELTTRYLDHAIEHLDLFVTTKPDVDPRALDQLVERFPNSHVAIAENRGRDIRPFVLTLRHVQELGYEFVCKIHTKKSPHRDDGDEWRHALIDPLLAPGAAARAIARFDGEPRLGLLAPAGSLLSLAVSETHLGNLPWLDTLLRSLKQNAQIGRYELRFPAGSMFWARTSALADLLTIDPESFELEDAQLDGTLAHAIERLIGAMVQGRGQEISET